MVKASFFFLFLVCFLLWFLAFSLLVLLNELGESSILVFMLIFNFSFHLFGSKCF